MGKELSVPVAAGVIGAIVVILGIVVYFQFFAGGRGTKPRLEDPRVNQMYSPPRPGGAIAGQPGR